MGCGNSKPFRPRNFHPRPPSAQAQPSRPSAVLRYSAIYEPSPNISASNEASSTYTSQPKIIRTRPSRGRKAIHMSGVESSTNFLGHQYSPSKRSPSCLKWGKRTRPTADIPEKESSTYKSRPSNSLSAQPYTKIPKPSFSCACNPRNYKHLKIPNKGEKIHRRNLKHPGHREKDREKKEKEMTRRSARIPGDAVGRSRREKRMSMPARRDTLPTLNQGTLERFNQDKNEKRRSL